MCSVNTYVNYNLTNGFCRPKLNACEITVFVDLPVSYLNKKIPYKYVIYSTHSNGEWEYIHDLRENGIFNRCLELRQSSSIRKFIIK